MTIKLWACMLITVLSISLQGTAQLYTQTLRGQVIEKNIQKPIMGATIQIEGTSLGAVSDIEGNFSIQDIPIGRHQLICTAMGFKELVLPNILIQSGKEMVITIAMEEKIHERKNIVIKGNSKKNKPLNEMSLV
ncbi:MAG: carboxypeptidase-like regulatory domain-containing protein, partial [Chitinophagaceae bacterium]|nr:carboxypeptidase-like regulatory domain-containing protein [Chitinophagaceae bacterium]